MGQILWLILRFTNGFIPSVAKSNWTFVHSWPNWGNSWSIFFHCIESTRWQSNSSHLLSSACHIRFLASFGFTNKCLSLRTIGRYPTIFKMGSSFSIRPLSSPLVFFFYHDNLQFGHFFQIFIFFLV